MKRLWLLVQAGKRALRWIRNIWSGRNKVLRAPSWENRNLVGSVLCKEVVNTNGAEAWDRYTATAAHRRNENPIYFFASERQFTGMCCDCRSLTEKSDSKGITRVLLCVGVFLRNLSPATNMSLQCCSSWCSCIVMIANDVKSHKEQ